jgi:hypothetical protein
MNVDDKVKVIKTKRSKKYLTDIGTILSKHSGNTNYYLVKFSDPYLPNIYCKEDELELIQECASEIEFLRWFYQEVNFGPADRYMRFDLKIKFMESTGKELPKGYGLEEE